MQSGALVWNEELLRAHFESMHAAEAERRKHHDAEHLATLPRPATGHATTSAIVREETR
jgi:hypothetical protein